MREFTYVVVFVTTASIVEANLIVKTLLDHRMIACASIIPQVNSSFLWQENIDTAKESLIIMKTKATLIEDIVVEVKRIHSYEIPEVIALPIIGGNPDYLKWIDTELGERKV